MASQSDEINPSRQQEQADFVQAFQELARGERAATALENQLSSMEAKLDALLAEAEQRQAEVKRAKATQADKPLTNGTLDERDKSDGGFSQ